MLSLAGGGLVASQAGNPEVTSQIDSEDLAAMNEGLGTDMDAATATGAVGGVLIVAAVLMILAGVFNLLQGIFGLNAAKGKSAKPAFVVGVIALALQVLGSLSALSQGGNPFSNVLGLVLSGLFVYCAYNLKKVQG